MPIQKACTESLYNVKGFQMPIETTYTSLRENLASVLDRVIEDHEIVIVRRKGSKAVALVSAEEILGLIETAHLLRSPKNAKRLLTAARRAERGEGLRSSIEELRGEIGIERPR